MRPLFFWLCGLSLIFPLGLQAQPIRLHPQNPHYFDFQGETTILVGSTEHYGLLLNRAFNYKRYFSTLRSRDLNLTRVFSGIYCEPAGEFNIAKNTLAPQSGDLLCPWARSGEPGYINGGNKFDLNRWDPIYFARLHEMMQEAARNHILVEFTLFCVFYRDISWRYSPLHPDNHINYLSEVKREDVISLKNQDYVGIQEAMVRKIVTELNSYDNLFFEVINEPYQRDAPLDWQARVVEWITDTEKDLPKKHLIASNVANHHLKLDSVHPEVDILNFHYALPEAARHNYKLNRALGDDETGFHGQDNLYYRQEAWHFMLNGGALFDHLDYSFAVGHEAGDFLYPSHQPGGGNDTLRRQFQIMKKRLLAAPLLTMHPDSELVELQTRDSLHWSGLVEKGKYYLLYFSAPDPRPFKDFSIRWQGNWLVGETGLYEWETLSDDGVRLWVGDSLLIDHWTQHTVRGDTGFLGLTAGDTLPLRVDYFQRGGGYQLNLRWQSPTRGFRPIHPSSWLGNGLGYQVFAGPELEKPLRQGRCLEVNAKQLVHEAFWFEDDLKFKAQLELPLGEYRLDWISPLSGKVLQRLQLYHPGGKLGLLSPPFKPDLVLEIVAQP
jgi:hypothetical protein